MAVTDIEFLLRSPDASWDYQKWEQIPNDGYRYEVIDGVLYRSTVPSYYHQRTVAGLLRHVAIPLERGNVAIATFAPIGVIFPGADPIQPDFLPIRNERLDFISEGGRIRGVPNLIAEVLSPNDPELDTEIKGAAYARAGVPEYWILRPTSRDVLVCSAPDTELSDYTDVRRYGVGTRLTSPTLPIEVPVDDLFEPDPDPA